MCICQEYVKKMLRDHSLRALLLAPLGVMALTEILQAATPNLIYILTDDLGYGDISALNPDGKIQTPHVDRLVAEGMTFTDAHSSSSVCTPTRYNVLTGRYNWRTHLKSGVLDGYGKPLIAEDRLTWASMLQAEGYQTAMIGKWHLGMELPIKETIAKEQKLAGGRTRTRNSYVVDWSQPIGRTPTSNGFDYFWGHGASLDFPPYVYIENNRYTSQSVSKKGAPHFGIKKGFRPGWIADDFDPRTTLDEFCVRSAEYIRKWDGKRPFALYVPLTSPHTPIIPTKEWQGKSGVGDYGDFVMQTDAVVGAILDAVDQRGIAENTIIVFTADNGCSPAADIDALASQGHHVSHIYRGNKADIYEGGHRVPHIIRWPAKVQPSSTTNRLTVLGDIVATMADIVGTQLPENAAEDSMSFYPVLLGKYTREKEHLAIINHSIGGAFAVRTKEWKLAFCPGSAGWSHPKDSEAKRKGSPDYQLYDMLNDPGETQNLYEQKPEVVERLIQLATDIVINGRSTPGKSQANDTANDWKQLHWIK